VEHPPSPDPSIVEAMAPDPQEIATAADIITAAIAENWAPISFRGNLHDRASYRYYWHVIERAYRTGRSVPDAIRIFCD
jgi:citrate lyase subunit beta/citryl-CoA lyase